MTALQREAPRQTSRCASTSSAPIPGYASTSASASAKSSFREF